MRLENFIAVLVSLCIFAFGIIGNKYLNFSTLIFILSILGLIMFALIIHFFTDRYYQLKNKIKNNEQNIKKLKEDFKIEKRVTILEEKNK